MFRPKTGIRYSPTEFQMEFFSYWNGICCFQSKRTVISNCDEKSRKKITSKSLFFRFLFFVLFLFNLICSSEWHLLSMHSNCFYRKTEVVIKSVSFGMVFFRINNATSHHHPYTKCTSFKRKIKASKFQERRQKKIIRKLLVLFNGIRIYSEGRELQMIKKIRSHWKKLQWIFHGIRHSMLEYELTVKER